MSTKIFDAVTNSQYSKLDIFLKHGYNFKVKTDQEGFNALMLALTIADAGKRFKMFDYLLRNNAGSVIDIDKNGRNIFFWVVIKQYPKELEILMLNFHPELDWTTKDYYGQTILHYSVLGNNIHIMSILLKYCHKFKINVNIANKFEKIS